MLVKPQVVRVAVGTAGLVWSLLSATAAVPVIYCTDLFHPPDDPDDHFDLATVFALRQVELKAIILDQGLKQLRRPGAIPLSQLNHCTGRAIPWAIGLAHPLKHPTDPALDQPTEFQAGVKLILDSLRAATGQVMVATLGSVRDLVAAFNREPELCRKKIGRVLAFIGEASEPSFQEYNVSLDPQAYVGLMRSGLPVWWVPCFDGGLWQNRGHASFWRAPHRELLQGVAPQLWQYFIYALERETNDPIRFLSQPVDLQRKERLLAGQRNLWCAAVLAALAWPANKTATELFEFEPVDVVVTDNGLVRYSFGPGSRRVWRFKVRDPARYGPGMTAATARLLEQLPIRAGAPGGVPAGQDRGGF